MSDVTDVISIFSKLPGIGKKSAARIVYHLLKNQQDGIELSIHLKTLMDNIKNCSLCGNYTTNDICEICSDPQRSIGQLCIVEMPSDMEAIENTGIFTGQYHILLGSLNPIEGITPEHLRIKELLNRLKDNEINEIIIATNPTIEGEATFLYLQNLIDNEKYEISKIAIGIPMGGSLEYTDKLTLTKALQQKLIYKN